MDKILESKFKDWSSLSESISKIYLKIIEHEQQHIFDKEYEELLYILPTALRLEKKNFLNMELEASTVATISPLVDISTDKIADLEEGETSLLSLLRKYNYVSHYITFFYNDFYEENTNAYDIFSKIIDETHKRNVQNKKYQENFYNSVNTNYIQMLEKYIAETDDEDVRNYLIYIKYMVICTTPRYEENYWLFGRKTLPTVDMTSSFPETDGYSDVEINELVKHSLKSGLEDDIRTLAEMNNLIFPYYSRKIYRMLALNKARLISLRDLTFIEEVENAVSEYINKNDSFYDQITSCLNDMFKDAKEIIKKKHYQLKKGSKK